MSVESNDEAVRFQVSAGGVVYRPATQGGVEIILIAHRRGEPWRLPKGRVEPGESLMEAALREVLEETGVEGEIVERLCPIEYSFWWTEDGERVRYRKRVYFFLIAYGSGHLEHHGVEVEDARWFPIDRALSVITYREEQEVVARARARIQAEANLGLA